MSMKERSGVRTTTFNFLLFKKLLWKLLLIYFRKQFILWWDDLRGTFPPQARWYISWHESWLIGSQTTYIGWDLHSFFALGSFSAPQWIRNAAPANESDLQKILNEYSFLSAGRSIFFSEVSTIIKFVWRRQLIKHYLSMNFGFYNVSLFSTT
jgi:hypothetical protein